MTQFLVSLKMYGDDYYRTVVTATSEMPHPRQIVSEELSKLASANGFHFEVTRLDTLLDMERFLKRLTA